MESLKSEFPIFANAEKEGRTFIYFDSASSTQKPQSVIDAITEYYGGYYANVGRGLYWPATQASNEYAKARDKVRNFVGAKSAKEVIFTSGTTDAINKVANAVLLPTLEADDQVLVSEMEHHSNFVPWQQACIQKGADLKVIPLTTAHTIDLAALKATLNSKVKFVAITAVSNTLGTKNDIKIIVRLAHAVGALVLVDASQLTLSERIDVQKLDCDFLTFSAHKLFGPTGIGILYGKQALLERAIPFSYGGGMVALVNQDETTFADLPAKHEAGTPNIAGAIGLGAAIDFVESIGVAQIAKHNAALRTYTVHLLNQIEGVNLLAEDAGDASILSFTMEGIHPHDIATFLAEKGIAVRAGHHCTQPLLKSMGLPATVRLSFSVYNDQREIEQLKTALEEIKSFFG
ncbi:MAG: cysteine desulfurase CsdA [Cytophagales bacterium CG12_big_fil_rev_8_21_14_0_65_40_12]|nr:MAG: cysteine desulfurase CsdA [Cytophagales bacterium CG12_big_fil_rev_8_21_14_0_65_40_12]PIW04037.1 MAG: cysteine desulfurase CsdA [Cytophagales bacterium CG17_big_fil_post_rev_8_21_14_2_50_40_13]